MTEITKEIISPSSDLSPKRRQFPVKTVSLLLGTLVLMFLLVRWGLDLNTQQITTAVKRFRVEHFLPALLGVLVQVGCQFSRVWVLFPRSARLGWAHVARAFSYGQLVNTFAPARAGDVIKAMYLRRQGNESHRDVELTEAVGVLLADKAVDALSLILVCAVAMAVQADRFSSWLESLHLRPIILTITFVPIVLFLAWTILKQKSSRMRRVFEGFVVGFGSLRDLRRVTPSVLFGVGAWLAEISVIFSLASAQGWELTYDQLVWVLVVLNLGVAIPISFANLGTFEAVMTFALTQLGVPLPEAIVIATAHHIFQFLGVLLWAAFWWINTRLAGTEESPLKSRDKKQLTPV